LLTGLATAAICAFATARLAAQAEAAFDEETLRHFQALLRLDTTSPPGNEGRAVDYLKQVLDREGIPYQVFAKDPRRPNLVAHIRAASITSRTAGASNASGGSGPKRPILVMGHTDVVTVDASKWSFPPFAAQRDGGYIYGRGAVDDKDNLVAGLMLVLWLKRTAPALDRDVIFLAESGEEGAPEVGAQFMIDQHFDAIDAEFCFAEGGGAERAGGVPVRYTVGTTEKEPRPVELVAKGPSGHGSVPLMSNAIAHLASAVDRLTRWSPPLRLNETTRAYFSKLAQIEETATPASTQAARRYRDIVGTDAAAVKAAEAWMAAHEPEHWSMLHTSLSPTIIAGGFRYNVIPSEAKATIDVRLHPDEDQTTFLDVIRKVVNDPTIEVRWTRDRYRPAGASKLTTEAFTAVERQAQAYYKVPVVPTMGTGATDMAQVRSKDVQCYGIGPATDNEDGAKGFGAHADQERILESELYRFVRFQRDVVLDLARAK